MRPWRFEFVENPSISQDTMLYIVTLTHARPAAEVQLHLDAHREWLARHIDKGDIVAAGPLDDGPGGIVLARAVGREALAEILASDPFVAQRVVDVQVRGFNPVSRAAWFDVQ
jgi:uncharacterized protein YciI